MSAKDSPQAPNRQATMQSRRIDLEREISIRVPAFDTFITEYSANISATGMFIRSEKPLPPDTALTFEFRVADDWKLIRGKATVVWSRHRHEGADRPAGMGVLFNELDAQSRRLINWIIDKHVREGGTPFDLGELKEEFDERLAEMSDVEASTDLPPAPTRVTARPRRSGERSEPTRARSTPAVGRRRFEARPVWKSRLSLILAGLVVASTLGGLFWLSEKGAQSVADPESPEAAAREAADDGSSDTAATDASAATAASGEPAAAGSGEPGAPTEPPPAVAEAIRRLIGGWSEAWQSQNVEAYLSHYSPRFMPATGGTRSAWAGMRQQRLTEPEFIEITVSDLEIEWLGGARARATFEQGYRSDTFEDRVRKVLELVREDGRWKILEERSAG